MRKNSTINVTSEKTAEKISSNLLDIEDLKNLSIRDIKSHPIKSSEIRNAVETYYDIQKIRVSSGNRKFATENENKKNGSDNDALYLRYIEASFKETEETIAKFLKYYVETSGGPIGEWLLSIPGIGPVLAAALLAYIDISKCETAGAIWTYAGWEQDMMYVSRKKGEKIHYNPKFRTICWKIGQSFIKVSGRKNDIYGKLYKEKREWYERKNEAGGFAEKAKTELSLKKYNKNTASYKAYSEGKLPDAQIVAMAARFATKMFLSHLFDIWYEYDRGTPPPKPFVVAHEDHVHIIKPPHREIVFPE